MKNQGMIEQFRGLPIFEDKYQKEGTYTCLDKDNLPIKAEDLGKVPVSKIIVRDFKTFKIAIENNQDKNPEFLNTKE